jgi:hypothetical protein
MNYYAVKNKKRLFVVINTKLPNIHNILKSLPSGDLEYINNCFRNSNWEGLEKSFKFFNKPRVCKASIVLMFIGWFPNKPVSIGRARRKLYGVRVEFNKTYKNPGQSFPVRWIDNYIELLDLPKLNLLVYDLPSFMALWYQRY